MLRLKFLRHSMETFSNIEAVQEGLVLCGEEAGRVHGVAGDGGAPHRGLCGPLCCRLALAISAFHNAGIQSRL